MPILQSWKNKLKVLYTRDRATWFKELIFCKFRNNSVRLVLFIFYFASEESDTISA